MMRHIFTTKTFEDVTMLNGHITLLKHHFTYCSYYVDGLLIDCGPPSARYKLLQWLHDKPLEAIVLTHHHEDHSGNAAFLSNYFHIPVYMSKLTKDKLDKQQHLPLYRKLIWGNQDKHVITNTQIINTSLYTNHHSFQVLTTPGHTEDHISLFNEKTLWLFSGDLYLGKRLLYGMKGESVPLLINSINKVLSLPFKTIFCGHAGIVEEGRIGLETKYQFLTELMKKTRNLEQEGYSPNQITEKILPKQQLVEIFSFGEMSPSHLIKSILK